MHEEENKSIVGVVIFFVFPATFVVNKQRNSFYIKGVKNGKPRRPSRYEDPAQQRIRRNPRARIWHIDSRPCRNQKRDEGGAGSRISSLDTAERYRTEKEVGEAMQEVFKAGKIKREDVFVATKLWNNNHRPERVKPAFEASLKKLQLDYVDLYLIHTPFAFQPGDEQDPRDANGNVIYDKGVTLLDTWKALETLVDEGRCKAIGLSDVSLEQTREIFDAARIKPAVVHVESHPYLPEWDLLDYCKKNGIVFQAFAALGTAASPTCWKIP